MNYQLIYNNIINNSRYENRRKLQKSNELYVYYELHHIIPKCLGGGNDKDNLILLLPKEHYLCHKLLTQIYPNDRKIASAYHYMTHNKRYKISAKNYAYEKQFYASLPVSEETRKKMRLPKSEETKLRMKLAWIERRKNGVSQLTKDKISRGLEGRHHSQETIEKLRTLNSGKNNPMYKKGKAKVL